MHEYVYSSGEKPQIGDFVVFTSEAGAYKKGTIKAQKVTDVYFKYIYLNGDKLNSGRGWHTNLFYLVKRKIQEEEEDLANSYWYVRWDSEKELEALLTFFKEKTSLSPIWIVVLQIRDILLIVLHKRI